MNKEQAPAGDMARGEFIRSAATPASSVISTASAPREYSLTKREQEVLELVAFGLGNKEIANRLALSRRTVETHIEHVLRKLDVPTRKRAVSEAGRVGLLGSIVPQIPGSLPVASPNNLPYHLTTLLGREQDLEDVKTSLQHNRLLTLSGSGGVGKTRLAQRVGVDLIPLYPDGVWFCDFSPISDPKFVPSVVARVLGVREHPGRSIVQSIVQSLKRKHVLLILDNCEHVLDMAAELADEILHTCPSVRILATSRQPLGIIGEIVHRVRSLSYPEVGADLTADGAAHYGAIALFMDRAQSSDNRFTITNDNAAIVVEICRRLDGIPLAIELAAARICFVNVDSLAQSLDDRFKVLAAGSRTALPRHKTLKALIDWSYDLLSPAEQKLFQRLGIFAGSFTLKAAAAVCGGDEVNESNLPDLITALVDKSLLAVQTGGKQERYRLLDSTRAYALEKLISGGERERLAQRQGEFFREQAKSADKCYGTGSTSGWLTALELDLENFRTALKWAFTQANDVTLGAEVAASLQHFWGNSGLATEGLYWVGAGLGHINELKQPAIAAGLWLASSWLSSGLPAYEAAERAQRLYQSIGDNLGASRALHQVAWSLYLMGRLEEAAAAAARALEGVRQCEDQVGIAGGLTTQAAISSDLGDISAARAYYGQAVAAHKVLGDEVGVACVLVNLGELEFATGNPEQALHSASQAVEIFSRGSDPEILAIASNNCAAYRIAVGDLDTAGTLAREGLRWARQVQDRPKVGWALQHLALLAVLRGQVHRAAQLLGYVNAKYNELALERESTEKWGYQKLMATLRKQMTEAEIERLLAEGATWHEDQATKEALKI